MNLNLKSNFLCQSARECPNFLEKWESTNFDMGFQKKKHFKSIGGSRFFEK